MLNNNWNTILYNPFDVKTIFVLSQTLDTNIPTSYISELSFTSQNIKGTLPSGSYKVFKYHNHFPKNTLNTQSTTNDTIVENTKTILQYSNYNFAILIKISDDNEIRFNKCSIRTRFYIVACSENNEHNPYVTTNGSIIALELFNYNNANNIDRKVIFNLLINKYCNFYQLNIVAETFNTFTEINTLIFDYSSFCFHKHEDKQIKQIKEFDHKRFNDNNISNNNNNNNNNNIAPQQCFKNIKFKNLILLSNLIEMLLNSERILLYLQLIQIIIMKKITNQNIITILTNLIIFNSSQCLIIDTTCYYLRILYGTNSSFITFIYTKLTQLNNFITLEIVVKLIHNMQNVVYYLKQKINIVKNNIALYFETSLNNSLLEYSTNLDLNGNNNFSVNTQLESNIFSTIQITETKILDENEKIIINKIIKINLNLLQTLLNLFALPQTTEKIKNTTLITSNQEILDNYPTTIIDNLITIINSLISTNIYATSETQTSIATLKDELYNYVTTDNLTKRYCDLIVIELEQYLVTGTYYLLNPIPLTDNLFYEVIAFDKGCYNFNQSVINYYNISNCVIGEDLLFYSLNFTYILLADATR